jgi:mannose-6-phosphate isomerase-like protein (cupin superfamily)
MGHEERAEFRIFRAADAIEADSEHVELVGLTDADGQGIAVASQAGLALGAIVKILFSDQASGLSITYAWLKSHYALPRHSHDADCAYLVLSGEARLGSETLTTGDGFIVPAGHHYQYAAGPAGVEVIEFRPAATYNMRFSGNGERFWSRVAEISEKNREAWCAEGVPAIVKAFGSGQQC